MIWDRGHTYYHLGVNKPDDDDLVSELTYVGKDQGQTEVIAFRTDGDLVQIPRYSRMTCKVKGGVVVPRQQPTPVNKRITFTGDLRDGQKEGVKGTLNAIKETGGCTIVADPGSGKTVFGIALMDLMKIGTAMVIVDQVNLLEQWVDRIRMFAPDAEIRLITAEATIKKVQKKHDLSGTAGVIYVATGQTLYRSKRFTWKTPLLVDLLVCDEAHAFAAPSFVDAITRVNFRFSIALTATPDRKDELEAVFQAYLGTRTVHFEGDTMDPEIHIIRAPTAGIDHKQWYRQWCKRIFKMTTDHHCQDCEYLRFRPDCGGDLPWDQYRRQIAWGDHLDYTGMAATWSSADEVLDWGEAAIEKLMSKNRRVFYFATNIDCLVKLFERSLLKYGAEKVGLYIGRQSCPKEHRDQLRGAELKDLSFATYKKGAKGLDVPNKDALVLGSPTSDARQVVGRIGRVCDDKHTPIVVLPNVNIGPFIGARMKLERSFKEKGWKINYS